MHLPTILTALLLPLAAVAEEMTTTTATSYLTLTRTVTLQRAQMTGVSNSTSLLPTATTISPPGSANTDATGNPADSAGSALSGANVAAAAVAGVVIAALL